ncbi:AFR751Wp [Eremothecium gossypii ATCC 10895]|uniref:AFR751Wp n=1 Tax=Eremothecium gossypii (strain ATCC 10895 / CBS 109.51 / FGSC 9923 / NRRL Y-1056) TaxID=284811 RepID=D8FGE9_EREGS|nr:AFR751Wp [Eremothecium gossypii ATCC 10895]ADJ41798.1 AFR751Wp [Eremothecium gossypii ATCC 10895]AGO12862.1 AaceriAFR751Wp [[Ashbya] aceris (nom. inval.)]
MSSIEETAQAIQAICSVLLGEVCVTSLIVIPASALLTGDKQRRRTVLPKETKEFLESVFERKRCPNAKERRAIAEKCGLTPIQIRIWFTNKRMRSKTRGARF